MTRQCKNWLWICQLRGKERESTTQQLCQTNRGNSKILYRVSPMRKGFQNKIRNRCWDTKFLRWSPPHTAIKMNLTKKPTNLTSWWLLTSTWTPMFPLLSPNSMPLTRMLSYWNILINRSEGQRPPAPANDLLLTVAVEHRVWWFDNMWRVWH